MHQHLIPNRTVNEWVDYIQTLHHREIELSLERVAQVYRRLYPDGMKCTVITVAGTNGKGSTCEIIASIYKQSGYKVGKFSSPHLVCFGERYAINGENATDQALLDAFTKIEQARNEIPITFFEFGTLLAIELFCVAEVDVAVMEVGLGGRLDAINILDADVALITSISIDHTAWLGDNINDIAREKVGIARAKKPCVVGMRQPADSIVEHCDDIGANLHILGQAFDYQTFIEGEVGFDEDAWSWQSKETERFLPNLPLPFSQGGEQVSNAAIAIAAVDLLEKQLPVENESFVKGLEKAQILARCQLIERAGFPKIILDVAHNESSVQRLRWFVEKYVTKCVQQPSFQQAVYEQTPMVYALCGMLQDKEIKKSLACLDGLVHSWHFATINNERGATAAYLQQQSEHLSSDSVVLYDSVVEAYQKITEIIDENDILIVFGSFFVAGDILRLIEQS